MIRNFMNCVIYWIVCVNIYWLTRNWQAWCWHDHQSRVQSPCDGLCKYLQNMIGESTINTITIPVSLFLHLHTHSAIPVSVIKQFRRGKNEGSHWLNHFTQTKLMFLYRLSMYLNIIKDRWWLCGSWIL